VSLGAGLVHFWALDEASGSAVEDLAGDLGSGQVVGDAAGDTIIAAPAGFGNARDLGASVSQSYMSLYAGAGDSGAYELTEWTLTARFMRLGTPNTIYPGLWMIGQGIEANTVEVYLDDWDPRFGFNARTNNGTTRSVDVTTDADAWDGNWHRVTLTNDNAFLRLYFDGAQRGSINISQPVKLLLKKFSPLLGAYRQAGGDITVSSDIAVDDLAIFSRALSAAEVGSSEFLTQSLIELLPAPFTALPGASQYFYLDIDDGVLSPLRIPISSWQATLQADRSSFVQAVIPAALEWVDELTARQETGEIIITHAVRQIDGSEQEWEVVRAPLQQINFDRGPQRATARVSSYTTMTAGPPETSVTLRNVRSVSISPGVRVRCDLDPTVRPGNTVTFGSTSFVAAYINHYATGSERYMDVGERPL
jgi:hypothetical protein